MNLLDKFAAVEIKADNRISEADRDFCQRHQEAYICANKRLKELADLIDTMKTDITAILGPEKYQYGLICCGNDVGSGDAISSARGNHDNFICTIVRYFADAYSVELDAQEVADRLLPKEPDRPGYYIYRDTKLTDEEKAENRKKYDEYEKSVEEYTDAMDNLIVRYEDIVDEIFVQLGGFSFTEQALNELKEKCFMASHPRYNWNKTDETESFEIKKDTLRITGYACSYKDGYGTPRWEITDTTKNILDGIAHFERGEFNGGCKLFSALYDWRNEQNLFEYSWLEKVRSVKLFKNGRVDIKFSSAAAVNEFVDNYLRVKVGGAA